MKAIFVRLAGILSILSLITFLPCLSVQPPISILQRGIELGINQQFEEALLLFSSVEKQYPAHPAGLFFKAAIYQSMMLDYESNYWRDLFYQSIDSSIVLAEKQLQQGDDRWMQFYLGAAHIFKSSQLAREARYLASLRSAKKGLGYLRRLVREDSTFCDPYLGLGTYDYWRSKFTLILSWLPFFPDRRAEGIAAVLKSAECAIFSRWAAYSNLCWIYIKEQNYPAAIYYARIGLKQFPKSRFFLWPLAEAQFKNGDFGQAIITYQELLASIQAEKINNHYNEVFICRKLAQSYYRLGDLVRAGDQCQYLLALPLDDEMRDRAKDKQKAAQKMLAILHKK